MFKCNPFLGGGVPHPTLVGEWATPSSTSAGGTPIQSWMDTPIRKDGGTPIGNYGVLSGSMGYHLLGRMGVPPVGKDGVPIQKGRGTSVDRHTDRHESKHYLPSHFVRGR